MPLQANEQSPIHAMVQSDVMALSSLQRSYPYTIKAYRFDSNGDIQAIFGTGDGYLKGVAHANGQAWFTGTRTDQYVDAVPGEYKNAWRVDNSGVIQAAADLPTVRPGGTSEEEAAFDKIGYDGTGLYVPYSGFVPIITETSGDIINTTRAHAYLYEFNSNGVYVSNRIISEFAISAPHFSPYYIVAETQSRDIYIPHFKWKRRARGENPHFPHIFNPRCMPALWGDNPWVYAFSVLDARGNEIVPGEFIYNRSEQVSKLTYSIKLRPVLHRLKIVGGDYLGFGIYCFATDGPGLDINQSWRMSRYLLYWSGAFVGQYHFLHDFRGEYTWYLWDARIELYDGFSPTLIKNPDGDICTLDEPEIYGYGILRRGFWTTARIGHQFVGVAFQDSKDGRRRLYSQRAIDDFENERVYLQSTTKEYNGIQILYFSGTARRGYFLMTITSPDWPMSGKIEYYIVSSDFSARLKIPRDPNALYPFPTYISSDGYTCAYVTYDDDLTQGTITIVQHNIGTSEINQISSFAFPPSGYTGRLRRLVVHGGYYWLLGDWTAGENEYVILICDINGNVVKTHERVAGSAWGQQAPQVAHDPDTDSIWIITNGEIMEYA